MDTEKNTAATRMIETAGPLFADQPFDAVSTRQIAKAAGVNLSAISYHFENKEGLYRAIFEKIIEDLKPIRVGFGLYLSTKMQAAGDDRQALAEIVIKFVNDLLDSVMSPENPRWRMRLIIREMQAPTDCFDLVLEGHINVMHDLLGMLVAKILKEPAASPSVKLTTHSILIMCLQYALNEPLITARLGWKKMGASETHIIKSSLTTMVLRILELGEYIPQTRVR
ncbi:CerR family C-terminal domain-containing protein [Sneathiella marina]|uniref:CerR family C-terminal domain-containing protein n=1 Tax=Sneathiella marina TaxID=2950108 RepID=A0ABY4W5M4_9PROT|nr:CerR family C-terminal domain-containing protein [Sneathiella marina]USG61015.1 CerR family C-terminal domain-containing protein [Sneathiella marina]